MSTVQKSSVANTWWLSIALAIVAVCLMARSGWAEDAKALARKANSELRNAQRNMFSRKFEAALEHLKKAEELIKQVEAADPNHSQLKILKPKYERQKKDLEKRMGRSKPSKPSSRNEPSIPAGATPEKGDKLPAAVTRRIKMVDGAISKATDAINSKRSTSTDYKIKSAEYAFRSGDAALKTIEKQYADYARHADVAAARERLAAARKMVKEKAAAMQAGDKAAADASARKDALSTQWLKKLEPYVHYNGKKCLLKEPTGTANNLRGQTVFLKEARALLGQCDKTPFPDGKTDELKKAQEKLRARVKAFPNVYSKSLDLVVEDPDKEMKRLEALIAARMKEKSDKKANPLSNFVLGLLRKKVAAVESVVVEKDKRVTDLTTRLAKLEKDNATLRKRWISKTTMIADKYKGGDLKTLKAKAESIVKAKFGDAKVLRVTIISADFKEERAWEWTDTTKSAVHYRVTRSLSGQVAAKRGANVFLYTVHIAKNKQSDGTFGALRGHIMFTDPMLEENVKK